MTINFYRNEGAEEGVVVDADSFRNGGGLGNILVSVNGADPVLFGELAPQNRLCLLTFGLGLTEKEALRASACAAAGVAVRRARVRVQAAEKALAGRLQDMNSPRVALVEELLEATKAVVAADEAWLLAWETRA